MTGVDSIAQGMRNPVATHCFPGSAQKPDRGGLFLNCTAFVSDPYPGTGKLEHRLDIVKSWPVQLKNRPANTINVEKGGS